VQGVGELLYAPRLALAQDLLRAGRAGSLGGSVADFWNAVLSVSEQRRRAPPIAAPQGPATEKPRAAPPPMRSRAARLLFVSPALADRASMPPRPAAPFMAVPRRPVTAPTAPARVSV
jgi:hypothetical protein